jgi:hypothetical protein
MHLQVASQRLADARVVTLKIRKQFQEGADAGPKSFHTLFEGDVNRFRNTWIAESPDATKPLPRASSTADGVESHDLIETNQGKQENLEAECRTHDCRGKGSFAAEGAEARAGHTNTHPSKQG